MIQVQQNASAEQTLQLFQDSAVQHVEEGKQEDEEYESALNAMPEAHHASHVSKGASGSVLMLHATQPNKTKLQSRRHSAVQELAAASGGAASEKGQGTWHTRYTACLPLLVAKSTYVTHGAGSAGQPADPPCKVPYMQTSKHHRSWPADHDLSARAALVAVSPPPCRRHANSTEVI